MSVRPVRSVHLTLDYLALEDNLLFIEEPNRLACQKLWREYRELFCSAPGATHNHQAWPGGYADHVNEVLNYARHLYRFDAAFGRTMPFSLSDTLLVLFLHDIEKPFRLAIKEDGLIVNVPALAGKSASREFREALIAERGIVLTAAQRRALRYVEGEGDDYSRTERVMNELGAFCHKADVWSARQCYAHPRALADEWVGAHRHAS